MKIIEDLVQLADQFMEERGLLADFSKDVQKQLTGINEPAPLTPNLVDLRSYFFCSIDNDSSRDLDQLTYAERTADGTTIWVAIADVAALVKKGTPIDDHAKANTTSVYTPAKIFPMLPEKLSTDLTSLNENEDRVAMVVKMQISPSGDIVDSSIFQAIVHNYAKLTYNAIGGWLANANDLPDAAKQVAGLDEILRIQHEIAQILRAKRHKAGSLTLESSTPEVDITNNDQIVIQLEVHNFAHQLIEEFMVAANQATASHFRKEKIASLRRVVRIPKYWDRIREIAVEYGESLPLVPDSKALDTFLINRQKIDPVSFPDLSLSIIKLLGRGEYVVEQPDSTPVGHFALAVSVYTHSTAPNRRFPDLISQRQFKAFLNGEASPYTLEELENLAAHCTMQEDAATKVERMVAKSAGAALLSSRIGDTFKGIVTGANNKGTWVRIFEPAVEGKIVRGFERLKVGDKVTVRLKYVNVSKGFIDFTH